MYYEEPRIPALPGEENVTDGSVDDYGTDWENVDNGALEEEMAKCAATPRHRWSRRSARRCAPPAP